MRPATKRELLSNLKAIDKLLALSLLLVDEEPGQKKERDNLQRAKTYLADSYFNISEIK